MNVSRKFLGMQMAVATVLLSTACRTTSTSQVAADEVPLEDDYVPEYLTNVYDAGSAGAATHLPAAAAGATEASPVEGGTYSASLEDGAYVVVFAYQGSFLNAPRNSHSFASVFKVATDSTGRKSMTDSHTISFLPVDGTLTILDNVSEWGRNYSLSESIALARQGNRIIRHSGFWRIDDRLFTSLKARKLYLDEGARSGNALYKINPSMTDRQLVLRWAYDRGNIAGSTNCIAAVSDAIRAPGDALLDTGNRRGFAASDMIFASFAPWRQEALTMLPSNFLISSLQSAEQVGDVVLQEAPVDEDTTPAARQVASFRFFGGTSPSQLPVSGSPFVKDVIIGKSGECGPSGSFFANVKVGPGIAGVAPTVQDAANPSIWHPNGGQGRTVGFLEVTLRSQYQLDCTVTVSIR